MNNKNAKIVDLINMRNKVIMNKFEIKYCNTARKMQNAFTALIERKNIRDITVSEICNLAGVNRTTFYLHYDNVFDLLKEISDRLVCEFINGYDKQITLDELRSYTAEQTEFNTSKYLAPYLNFVKTNKAIYKVYMNNFGELNIDYMQHINKFMSVNIEKYGITDTTIINYMSKFYFTGVMAIVLEWVNNDCKEDVASICEIIALCTRHHISTNN